MVMRQILAAVLGVMQVGNGLVMFFAPQWWFERIPGIHPPFNAHLVQDIGAAFIAAGVGLGLRALNPAWWPAAAIGALFLILHGGLHAVEPHHAVDAVTVVIPALLALLVVPPGLPQGKLAFSVEQGLRLLERRYDYNADYMRMMYRTSPAAFWKFSALFLPASHRSAAPVEGYFAAKLVGALSEDCGPCTQLVVNMAREAGVAGDQLTAVLTRDEAAMSAATRLGWRFATAVCERLESEDEAREAVRQAWGDAGLIDLSLAVAVGRVYPMTKAGLGFAKECRMVNVGGEVVGVVHAA